MPFSIDFDRRPYNTRTTVRVCDQGEIWLGRANHRFAEGIDMGPSKSVILAMLEIHMLTHFSDDGKSKEVT